MSYQQSKPTRDSRRRLRCQRGRFGVAATELAVCLPIIVLITIATIEASAMIFLQQSLSVAAYEGARVALSPGADATVVSTQSETILNDRGVAGVHVDVSPSDIEGAPIGSWISVQASAPFTNNSLTGGWLFSGRTLTANVQMMKEQ